MSLVRARAGLRITVTDRSAKACLDGLESLSAQLADESLASRYPRDLTVEFVVGRFPRETVLDATAFFGMLEDIPETAPAVRRMLEAFLATPLALEWALNGECLSAALKTLGVLDASAVAVIRRYPADTAHNPLLMERILPAIVAAHGWTDDIVELAIDWVLLQQLHNEAGAYWRKRGLGAAIAKRYTPQAFVDRMKADDGEMDFSSVDFSTQDFAAEIAPFTRWERQMFALIGIAEPQPRKPIVREAPPPAPTGLRIDSSDLLIAFAFVLGGLVASVVLKQPVYVLVGLIVSAFHLAYHSWRARRAEAAHILCEHDADDTHTRGVAGRSALQLEDVGWPAVAAGYLALGLIGAVTSGAGATKLAMVGLPLLAAVASVVLQAPAVHENEGTVDEMTPVPLWYLHAAMMLLAGAMAGLAIDVALDAHKMGALRLPGFLVDLFGGLAPVICFGVVGLAAVSAVNVLLARAIGWEGQFSKALQGLTGRSWA